MMLKDNRSSANTIMNGFECFCREIALLCLYFKIDAGACLMDFFFISIASMYNIYLQK